MIIFLKKPFYKAFSEKKPYKSQAAEVETQKVLWLCVEWDVFVMPVRVTILKFNMLGYPTLLGFFKI